MFQFGGMHIIIFPYRLFSGQKSAFQFTLCCNSASKDIVAKAASSHADSLTIFVISFVPEVKRRE